MTDRLILQTTVTYGDVDRHERMLLARIFKLLQDAAITHANQFGTGTNAVATRGESWVLNRMAVRIAQYPRAGDALTVVTWSTGIKGFKGYRDFRVYAPENRLVISASSLWLYISLATKSIVRVPRDVAATFPVGSEPAAFPDLEARDFDELPVDATVVPMTLRYSDFDVNEHVNNAAYLELAQSAFAQCGAALHPSALRLKYAKAIPLDRDRVNVTIAPSEQLSRFTIGADGQVFAVGEAEM